MIVLIRHGETVWNREGRKQGRGDSSLTKKGEQQARAIGLALKESGILNNECRIVSSPLGRTKATAEIICSTAGACTSDISFDELLMEADHGEWEGMTASEIEALYPGQLSARLRDHWSYRFPEGESYNDLSIRIEKWLESNQDDGPTVVITHDMISRVMRKQYLGSTISECLSMRHQQNEYFILADDVVLRRQVKPD